MTVNTHIFFFFGLIQHGGQLEQDKKGILITVVEMSGLFFGLWIIVLIEGINIQSYNLFIGIIILRTFIYM